MSMNCAIVLFLCFVLAQGSSSSSGSADTKPVFAGAKPDPWVEAAPLILGAACRNGVALVAIHPSPTPPLTTTTTNTQNDKSNMQQEFDNSHSNKNDMDWTETYRDTVRIHPIDSQGTALLCCGWRTDGEWLAEQCRSISRDHVRSFGSPSSSLILADEASLWMAHCTASDTVRPLSVVGLLASFQDTTTTTKSATGCCYLHLVDATGAHRVRAHAVGCGAKTVNARLRSIRFETMTAEEGLDRLVQVLLAAKGEDEDDAWQALQNTTRVEMAIVDAEKKCLQRIRQPFLVVVRDEPTQSVA